MSPAMLDFLSERHLHVFGAKGAGKTHLLASIMTDLTSRFTPEQVLFLIVDFKGSRLQDVIDQDYLLRWSDGSGNTRTGLALNAVDLELAVNAVAAAMELRRPRADITREQRRARSWWAGPEVFILVDDISMVNNAAPNVFAPLAPHWAAAETLGVHSVVACPDRLANRMLLQSSSLVKLNADVNAATVVMDGQKENGPMIAGVRLGPRQPGRAVFVAADSHRTIQTPVLPELEAGPDSGAW
jgi:S-DNA-T family DNA segregation ATPase FtsK/SpoIIIE